MSSPSILAPQPPSSSYDAPVGRFAQEWSANLSHAYVWSAYIIACGVGALAAYVVDINFTTNDQPLLLAGIADVAATAVVWVAAIITNNSSLYDPFWSVFTPLATVYWALVTDADVPLARTLLVNASVWVWAWRLTTNWSFAWSGLGHQDWRYSDIEATFRSKGMPKIAYWLIGSLGAIMMFPTAMVFASSVPAYYALSRGVISDEASSFNWLDVVATIVCVGAATVQWFSDRQMRLWREDTMSKEIKDREPYMDSGLWRYSRHPNYFGEVMFWWGIYFHALAASYDLYYTIPGAVIITLLFVFISIPLMEKRSMKRRPAYKRAIQTTSMLVPFFRKCGSGSSAASLSDQDTV